MGKHLVVDAVMGRKIGLDEAFDFLAKIPSLADVSALSPPFVVRGADHDPGVTGFIILEESHSSLHSFEKNDFLAFDLYSCNDFDEKKILSILERELGLKEISFKTMERIRP